MTTTLLHISDLHFGNEDKVALAAVGAFVRDHPISMVIASGDLTAVGSEREMRAAFEWLGGLPVPVVTTPGNHDTPYFDILPRLFGPFSRFHREAANTITAPQHIAGAAIVPINTARGVQFRKNWALGAISAGQVAAASGFLTATPADALKVVVTHHPLAWPAEAPIKGDTRGARQALPRLIGAGADIFLSGHLHTPHLDIVEHDGRRALLLSAGTLSIRHRGAPASFGLIEDGPRGIVVSIYNVAEGTPPYPASSFRFTRNEAGLTLADATTPEVPEPLSLL